MRFEDNPTFKLDELQLDEGNYRFHAARDQQDCISKIHSSGDSSNFGNLMDSIADDDLGEDLLVYRDKAAKKNIVLDGNRRLAALKVLHDPNLAPTDALRKKAVALTKKHKLDFSAIRAQVSTDRDLILKTVYERHAAGSGKSRINWDALAASRFRYENTEYDDGQAWQATALVFAVEEKDPSVSDFISSGKYSHDVFRRVVSAAVKEGVLEPSIFSENNKRLAKSSKSKLKKALDTGRKLIHILEEGELTLSRGKGKGLYADAGNVSKVLKDHFPSSKKATKNGKKKAVAKKGKKIDTGEDVKKIRESADLIDALNALTSKKLGLLYRSLVELPVRKHAGLLQIGAWAFYEVLGRQLGNSNARDFPTYFEAKIDNFTRSGPNRKELKISIGYINDHGNCVKHGRSLITKNADDLMQHFQNLEEFTIHLLKELKSKQ